MQRIRAVRDTTSGVVAEQPHDALSKERGKQGHRKGNHQRDADAVPPEEQCGVLVPADGVPMQMPPPCPTDIANT